MVSNRKIMTDEFEQLGEQLGEMIVKKLENLQMYTVGLNVNDEGYTEIKFNARYTDKNQLGSILEDIKTFQNSLKENGHVFKNPLTEKSIVQSSIKENAKQEPSIIIERNSDLKTVTKEYLENRKNIHKEIGENNIS